MKILVAYASKKGSTQDMAARIARSLEGDHTVDLIDLRGDKASRIDLAGYSLVVLGSPIYIGAWNKNAVAWIKARESDLAVKKLALFEIGNGLEQVVARTTFPSLCAGAVAVAKLGGEIRWKKLSWLEKMAIKQITKKTGDVSTIDQQAVERFIATLRAMH